MIMVDTNVIIDVVARDPVWLDWSRVRLNAAVVEDQVVINEVVYAELAAGYPRYQALDAFLSRAGLELVRTPRSALYVAGRVFQRHRAAGGIRTGVLPDFFIGAHAMISGSQLITRDVQRYRAYFPGLELISPDPS